MCGIGITYKRVMEIEDTLAKSGCKQVFQDRLVCPSHLRIGLYTVSALDNVDIRKGRNWVPVWIIIGEAAKSSILIKCSPQRIL